MAIQPTTRGKTMTVPVAHPAVQNGHTNASYLAAGGRVLMAAIFLLSGFSKASDPASALGYISSAGLPLPALALAGAITIELLGGLALVVGYRTRLVAALLALFSLLTAFTFHFDLADQGQFINFFKNVAMAGGLLQIVAFGGGSLSLDNRR